MTDIRSQLVALARSYAGVSVSTDRDRYVALVASGETASMAAYMAQPKTSGCALVVRGLWRLAGLAHPRLAPPYKPGLAVADVVSIARQHGAWVTDLSLRPSPGDVVLVGGDPRLDGGVEHVFTVLVCNGDALVSVDGGQRDAKGNQAIEEKIRAWTLDGGATWDRSHKASDPGSGARRRVKGWVDVCKLPFPTPMSVEDEVYGRG